MCYSCYSDPSNKPLLEHLHSRHLDVELHRPHLADGIATFYLYNLSGQMKGYQNYNYSTTIKKNNDPKDSRYYSYMTEPAWWGFESWELSPGLLFVTEGVFDAARLTARCVSAIATLSNDPGKNFKNFVFTCGRRVVTVCDNDENGSGRKLAKYGHQSVFCEDGKDLGDSSEKYVDFLLRKFT